MTDSRTTPIAIRRHAVGEPEKRIWFHGTSAEAAEKIMRTGFNAGTYFARSLEDAIGYGGLHVFEVLLFAPSGDWQIVTDEHVPWTRICEYYELTKQTHFLSRARKARFFRRAA